MRPDEFSDAAVVLLGHGSTLNSESGAPVLFHAAELRRRNCFAEVREAFWKQEPQVKAVLSSLTVPRVFLVPFFVSEGYFSQGVIPRELGFQPEEQGTDWRFQSRSGQTLIYCRPVGTHDGITEVLLSRAREVVEKFPFPRAPKPEETTLFVAGHGTGKNDNSRRAVEHQVALISRLQLYGSVHAVFLEEEPGVGACYKLAQTKHIVVVPFLISDGMHGAQDIPILLGEPERIVAKRLQSGHPGWRNPTERHGKLVWSSDSVGNDPRLVEIVLARVREAQRWPLKPMA